MISKKELTWFGAACLGMLLAVIAALFPYQVATAESEKKVEEIHYFGNGVYVFDIWMESNTQDKADGWAPMLAKWLEENPELRIVAIAPNVTTNKVITSMLVVTEPAEKYR